DVHAPIQAGAPVRTAFECSATCLSDDDRNGSRAVTMNSLRVGSSSAPLPSRKRFRAQSCRNALRSVGAMSVYVDAGQRRRKEQDSPLHLPLGDPGPLALAGEALGHSKVPHPLVEVLGVDVGTAR